MGEHVLLTLRREGTRRTAASLENLDRERILSTLRRMSAFTPPMIGKMIPKIQHD